MGGKRGSFKATVVAEQSERWPTNLEAVGLNTAVLLAFCILPLFYSIQLSFTIMKTFINDVKVKKDNPSETGFVDFEKYCHKIDNLAFNLDPLKAPPLDLLLLARVSSRQVRLQFIVCPSSPWKYLLMTMLEFRHNRCNRSNGAKW